MSPTQWFLIASDRAYRLLLVGYPASFRRRYGPEMAQVFRDCVRDARQHGGLLGLWVRTLGDLLATVPAEHLAALQSIERSRIMTWNTGVENHPFAERLAQVLDREPTYYQLLISTEPTRRMSDVIDCLALDGDWEQPEMTLTLFQDLRQDVPEVDMDRWLTRLRDAARRIYASELGDQAASLPDKILRLIYADPHLYELVAAVEPGYGLLDLVESMALEMNLEEVEPALALMRELCREPRVPVEA
ncbi:MAG: hypothetical protein JXA14_21100 [Anaerolineae bacterium]|nr:hypothetical protein [Anaerolineae bacterium]